MPCGCVVSSQHFTLPSPAYRSGQGFATHISALMLVPPMAVLGMRVLRSLLLSKVKRHLPHGRRVALVLTVTCVVLALCYTLLHFDTFTSTTVPFSQNRLMQSIGELHPPHYNDWVFRYGNLFIVGSIGLITATIQLCKKNGTLFVFPTSLFLLTTFFQDPLHRLLGHRLTYNLFLGALALVTLISLAIPYLYLKRTRIKNEHTMLACATWFVFWLTLARDAGRYDFFVGIPIAYFATHLLTALSEHIAGKLRHSKYTTETFQRDMPLATLRIAITLLIFLVLIFGVPPGKQAERLQYATTQIRIVFPTTPQIRSVFQWINTQLFPSNVVVTNPNIGSQLNVLGGVKTIIDQDHYIQHWIHLYYRHVFCARSNREALEFLKTHTATHLLLTANDIIFNIDTNSNIGSDENGDRRFTITALQRQPPKEMRYRMVPDIHADIPLDSIEFDIAGNTLVVFAQLNTGERVKMPAVALINKDRITAEKENKHGGIVIVFDEYQQPTAAYYVPVIGWDSLAVRLYFRGDIPDIFVPVYPTDRDASADVKIWEIHYPLDIQPDVKYLKTGIPEIDKDLQLHPNAKN